MIGRRWSGWREGAGSVFAGAATVIDPVVTPIHQRDRGF
jgi:hypothetical protein